MAALRLPVLVGDAEADYAEPRPGGVQIAHLAQHVAVHQETVVVEFDDHVHVPELTEPAQAHVPATGAAEVVVQFDRGHLARQAETFGELRQRAAVADDHDPGGGHVLLGHGGEQRVDLDGPVAHGHHGNGDPWPLLRLRHDTHPIPADNCAAMLVVHRDDPSRTP